MPKLIRQELMLFLVQLAAWLLFLMAPIGVSYVINPSGGSHHVFIFSVVSMLAPMALVYMINFYLLIPKLLFKRHYGWYALAAVAVILMCNAGYFRADVSRLEGYARTGFYTFITEVLLLNAVISLAAVGFRSYLRSHRLKMQLEEDKRKTAEAELVWLKNQLNPHFLFNSLNNISSLVQIDPAQAQESIAQLSDLLRYALYESSKERVPLVGEVEFMHNYIAMMQLRCSARTTIDVSMPDPLQMAGRPAVDIAPLLFVSFIENAFKHGTSSSLPSHIGISLEVVDGEIRFSCVNTNFPKGNADRSGSGIGLENTLRRLELCYAGAYSYQQELDAGSNEYRINVIIRL